MSIPTFHGIELALNGYIKNTRVEIIQGDPEGELLPGRLWYNDISNEWKFTYIDDNDLLIKIGVFSDNTNAPTILKKTKDDALSYTPLSITELLYIIDKGIIVYWDNQVDKWACFKTGTPLESCFSGTGPSGTFVTNLEDIGNGPGNGLEHWTGSIDDVLNDSSPGNWCLQSDTTPSSSTGPTAAAEGTYYIYTEVSNSANNNTFILSTTYFKDLFSISFQYNMYGSDTGLLEVQVFSNFEWIQIWSLSGDQGKDWQSVSLNNLDTYEASELRFVYSEATGYKGDTALDNINIIST